jgi:acetylornithine aminotransferase
VKPHLITIAKGMGNGFPVGGVLIDPNLNSWHGMLGTTFGGNYLACAASLAVLEIIEKENLIRNVNEIGTYWMNELKSFQPITAVRGKGLMIGFDVDASHASLRQDLLLKHHVFTGEAKPNTVRLLPSLAITREEAKAFLDVLHVELQQSVNA